jgi:CheY-like chemotaxis protein
VVTALEMLRLDGFQPITRIRREATLRGLPIIVMSSRTSRGARDHALAADANVFLPKSRHRRNLVPRNGHHLALSLLATARSKVSSKANRSSGSVSTEKRQRTRQMKTMMRLGMAVVPTPGTGHRRQQACFRVALTFNLAFLLACGFQPQPKGGVVPCPAGCPSGYYCANDDTCWQDGAEPPASPRPNTGGSGGTAETSSAVGTTGGAIGAAGGTSGGTITGGVGGGAIGANMVAFSSGKAVGAMTGEGWVALGSLDTITSPDCGSAHIPISSATPCATNWSTTDSLCITGFVPGLPSTPTTTDYDNNWGIQLGVIASADSGGTLARSYRTIAFTTSGMPTAGVRAVVCRSNDPAGTTYCANISSGTPINLTAFNTHCWDGSGTSLQPSDVPTIARIGLQISSTSIATTVTNFCLRSIVFGN